MPACRHSCRIASVPLVVEMYDRYRDTRRPSGDGRLRPVEPKGSRHSGRTSASVDSGHRSLTSWAARRRAGNTGYVSSALDSGRWRRSRRRP
jgi:hypothetical protein